MQSRFKCKSIFKQDSGGQTILQSFLRCSSRLPLGGWGSLPCSRACWESGSVPMVSIFDCDNGDIKQLLRSARCFFVPLFLVSVTLDWRVCEWSFSRADFTWNQSEWCHIRDVNRLPVLGHDLCVDIVGLKFVFSCLKTKENNFLPTNILNNAVVFAPNRSSSFSFLLCYWSIKASNSHSASFLYFNTKTSQSFFSMQK